METDINECFVDAHGCAHNCHNTEGAHHCSCDEGYMLNSDGRNCNGEGVDLIRVIPYSSCVYTHTYICMYSIQCTLSFLPLYTDIDECSLGTHLCNQICDNTPGNYTCDCNHGYSLSTANQYTCHGQCVHVMCSLSLWTSL